MIWKTKTHEFTATVCQKTGAPCPALARMARALTDAMATARPATTDAFEIEGSSDLTHCAEGCSARFRAQPDQIRVFCGVAADTPAERLDRYADMLFGADFTAHAASLLPTPPCAMMEVVTTAPQPAAPTEHQLSA
ncbi:hypothetical protein [Ruegeria lacuscaerulensis]|uniref:hypothetical protein n=1 Tax=Ruegeria lacuscaerulensis TaxID=55218 RepID=UPI00147E1C60|nr:hypothetical protein [Ruegeria lacuscaerulensis]